MKDSEATAAVVRTNLNVQAGPLCCHPCSTVLPEWISRRKGYEAMESELGSVWQR